LIRRQIAANGRQPLAQFFPISPIPAVAETAEPLITVRLRYRCSRPYDFPTLAASVARRTDLIQSAKSGRQLVGLGKRPLAGGFPCAINIKDDPGLTCSIYQTPSLLVRGEGSSEQVIEKKRAQRFDGFFRQGC